MTEGWSLSMILGNLHRDIETRLTIARESFAHAGTKGDASEGVWLELLKTYLPQRYSVDSAHVVDSEGKFSDQIDIVVYDRQYSPFIFEMKGLKIIPAESVYAVFEAKQTLNSTFVDYAQKKAVTVRQLLRTSLPVPYVEGTYKPKPLPHILAGVLTLDSDWTPALGGSLTKALKATHELGRLDLGCVAAHGHFTLESDGNYSFTMEGKPATAYLLELIARLQSMATVPMIDVRAYARWLAQ